MSRITECERCNASLTEREIWTHGTPKWCENCHRAVEGALEADSEPSTVTAYAVIAETSQMYGFRALFMDKALADLEKDRLNVEEGDNLILFHVCPIELPA